MVDHEIGTPTAEDGIDLRRNMIFASPAVGMVVAAAASERWESKRFCGRITCEWPETILAMSLSFLSQQFCRIDL